MAIKLKNMSRHWLAKGLTILLVLFAGLYMIWSSYQHFSKNPEFDLQFSYAYSNPFYEKMDGLYEMVYQTHYKPSGGSAATGETAGKSSPLPEGYYYLVATADGDFYTNIDHFKEEADFYQQTAAMVRIEGNVRMSWSNGRTYFETAPPEGDIVLIGLSYDQLAKENDQYRANWFDAHTAWLIGMILSVVLIFSGLILLAMVSGRKPDSDQLHFHSLDKIFLDVFLVLWLIFESIQIALMDSMDLTFATDPAMMILMAFAAVLGLIGLLYWTMIAKRIKSNQLFKHTLIGWLLGRTVGRVLRFLWTSIGRIKDGPFYLLPFALSLGFLLINAVTIVVGAGLSAAFGLVGFLIGAVFYLSGIGLLAIYLIYQDQQLESAIVGLEAIENGDLSVKLSTQGTKQFARLAVRINHIVDGFERAVKRELQSERMKAELITNVSHDLKTPLTSILNYVDLLKTKGLSAPEAPHYLDVLDQKSQRLRQLTEDLFEASKASSGSLQVQLAPIELQRLIVQATGEFSERLESAQLDLRIDLEDTPLWVLADGRHLWRVLENILLNAWKYAAPQSRVYLSLAQQGEEALLSLKNVSAEPLNIPAALLMERFTRGDLSRHSDGSGLGLSIAKSLTELQAGSFELLTDGDLFKVLITLPLTEAPKHDVQ